MDWWALVLIGVFIGTTFGVILGAILAAAGHDAARYDGSNR